MEVSEATTRCHCQSCLCDKQFAECFAQFPCPKMTGFLDEEECGMKELNATQNLDLKAL